MKSVSEPAWRAKPSWYLSATEDKMIPPPAQRQMAARTGATVTELPAAMPSIFRSSRPLNNCSLARFALSRPNPMPLIS